MTPFTSTLSAQRITRFLLRTIAVLGSVHLIGITLSALLRHPAIITAFKLVNLDSEHNIPTLFTVGLFILNSGLFFIIHRNTKTFHERHITWPLLGGTFAFLALDEFGSIHEQISTPLRLALNTNGSIFHFAWIIPYGIAITAIAMIITPTILKLRPNIRRWFILAAILYVTGAIGFEMISAANRSIASDTNFLYGLITGIEELLEMAGLTTIAYGLLRLIEVQYGGINLVIPNQNTVYKNYTYTSNVPQAATPIDFAPDNYFDYPEQIPEPGPNLYSKRHF